MKNRREICILLYEKNKTNKGAMYYGDYRFIYRNHWLHCTEFGRWRKGLIDVRLFLLVFIYDGLARFTTDIMRETVSSIGRALEQSRGCGFESHTVSLIICKNIEG